MCKFVVVEVFDRELSCVIPVDTFEEGINMANRMLKNRIMAKMTKDPSYEPHTDDYNRATSADANAWFYINNHHWDAYVTPLVGLKRNRKPVNDTYMLYGACIIEKDATLKEFCHSLFKNTICQNAKCIQEVMNAVEMQLAYDLPRTNIDYEVLLKRYVTEIGEVLIEIEANNEPAPSMDFKGIKSKDFFNEIVRKYIKYHLISKIDNEGNVIGWFLEED